MRIQTLFPIPLGFFELDPGVNQEELAFIAGLSQRANMGNRTSEDSYLMDRPELARLREFFKTSIDEYLQTIFAPKYDVELRITQCWANYTNLGEFHHKHEHPNSIVSGVFYVQSDSTQDRIYFYRNKYQTIKLVTENFNPFNSDSWWFEAVPNSLILFPSSLSHSVEAVKTTETRISISMNTFPVGKCGAKEELTELIL